MNVTLSFTKSLLAAIGGGLLWYSAFPPFDLGTLPILVAFVLLLWCLEGRSTMESAILGMVFGICGFGPGCFWVVEVFRGYHGLLLVPLMSLWTVLFSIGCARLLTEKSCMRFVKIAAWWAALEFIRGEMGPIPNPVLSFSPSLPTGMFLHPAQYAGIYGISFLIALTGALIYRVFWYKTNGKKVSTAIIAPVVLIALWAVAGTITSFPKGDGHTIHLLGVQAEIVSLERMLELTTNGLKEAAEKNIKIDMAVWPEYAIEGTYIEEDPELSARLFAYAAKNRIKLLFGNKKRITPTENDFLNTVFIVSQEQFFEGNASKSRPVPFLNDGLPTSAPEPVQSELGSIGIPICYDADFSLVNRGVTSRGAQLLIIPTRDRKNWGWYQHMQRIEILRLRALETGRYILRVSTSGPTVAVKPDGTFVPGGAFTTKETTMVAPVELRNEMTFYVKYGYLCGYIMLLYSILGLAGTFFRKERSTENNTKSCQSADSKAE